MLQYEVKIEGRTPYMQHRMDDAKLAEWEKVRGKIIERADARDDDKKRALYHSYMTDDGQFYIPGDHIRGAMIEAGKLIRGKVGGASRSMKTTVAGSFWTREEQIPLEGKFSIDKRSAVNNNVKARIIVIRPKWNDWSAKFTLLVDNDTMTDDMIKSILGSAGNFVGIGSFRPMNSGMFGRFVVTEFNQIR